MPFVACACLDGIAFATIIIIFWGVFARAGVAVGELAVWASRIIVNTEVIRRATGGELLGLLPTKMTSLPVRLGELKALVAVSMGCPKGYARLECRLVTPKILLNKKVTWKKLRYPSLSLCEC